MRAMPLLHSAKGCEKPRCFQFNVQVVRNNYGGEEGATEAARTISAKAIQ